MEALYRLERASAAEIQKALPDAPGYSSVRTLLRILEEKGVVDHELVGKRYVYRPKAALGTARKQEAKRLLETFFAGSTPQAVAALLDASTAKISDAELDDLQKLIDQARKEGR